MTLNLIFAKMNPKKRIKTVEEYKRQQSIADIIEQNKLKHSEVILRHYY